MSIKAVSNMPLEIQEQCTDKLVANSYFRVLLVEDDPGNLLVASIILETLAIEFDVAVNGYEAIAKANSGTYELIIMDIRMPGINGEEATRIIRDNERKTSNKPVKILCVTANAAVGDSDNYLAAGMDDYLSKPYKHEEFENKILKFLNENKNQ